MARKVDSSAHLRTQPSRAGKKDLEGNSMFDEKHYKQVMASVRPRSALYNATSIVDGISMTYIVCYKGQYLLLFSTNNFYLKRSGKPQFQFFYMLIEAPVFPPVSVVYAMEDMWVERDKDETEIANPENIVKFNIK